MDPPDPLPPPPPNLDPPLPASNVYILVVPGENPLNTFQRINVLSGLKATTVLPSKLVENKITVITLFYEKLINHSLALASTLLFKKAIEGEIKTCSMELGLVGLLDYNISFQATAKKECAIWFNGVVGDDIIKCTLDLLLKALGSSYIAQEYGFVPPKRYEYKLYFMPYLLGFLREELEHSLTRAGYEPKHLKLLQGKNALNSGTNIVGTHGNVILKTEVGVGPVSFVNVSTNRGVFNLSLEQKDFYGSSVPKGPTQSASTENNWLFKTRLCTHHASGRKCYQGINCSFAHGDNELRPKQAWSGRGFTHAPTPSSEGATADVVQPVAGAIIVNNVAEVIEIPDSDSMVIDEAQPGDGNFVKPLSASIVANSGVDDSISGVGRPVPGSLSGSENLSSSIASAIAINSSEISNGEKVSVPEVSATSAAMVVEGFVEKNAASTAVVNINTTVNLNAASPLVPGLDNGTKKGKKKREASSPLDGAIAKTSSTDLTAVSLTAVTPFVVPAYDIDFPASPTHSVLIQKGVAKERGISKSTPVSTGPAFTLNGKPVTSASITGAFNSEVPIPKGPLIVKTGSGKNDTLSTVKVNNVVTTPGGASVKTSKSSSGSSTASSPIANGGSTAKGSGSPSAANAKAATNVLKTSPLKQVTTPKPTGANFKEQTGNKYKALSDSATCDGGLGAQ